MFAELIEVELFGSESYSELSELDTESLSLWFLFFSILSLLHSSTWNSSVRFTLVILKPIFDNLVSGIPGLMHGYKEVRLLLAAWNGVVGEESSPLLRSRDFLLVQRSLLSFLKLGFKGLLLNDGTLFSSSSNARS